MAESVNPYLQYKKPSRKPLEYYTTGILSGNRTILSQAITLIESTLPADRQLANQLINELLPYSGNSFRIGITGVPGVGKSTFIEAFGLFLIDSGKKPAVLAIDPSSSVSGGSILGDKTRMNLLAAREEAFIRPSPSSGTLGGVARKTRETIVLCEAFGCDVIIVETVGVGQSETAVHSMTDAFLLLLLAGAGDELQGIKRGIMEMADVLVINKSDGDNQIRAKKAKGEVSAALRMFPTPASGWIPKVETASALEKDGIDRVWKLLESFQNHHKLCGDFDANRRQQASFWFKETITSSLLERFEQHPEIEKHLPILLNQVMEGKVSPFHAAEDLLNRFLNA